MSGRISKLVVGVVIAACSFDSGGVGGTAESGVGESSSSSATTFPTTTASTTTAPTTSSTDPTLTTTTVDPESSSEGSTSNVSSESGTTTAESGSESSTGETGGGPPEFGPFDDAVPIAELNSVYYDDDPTLRGDLLEIYFASLRPGGVGNEDIWRAERDSPTDPWDDPVLVDGINDAAQDGWPELSHDGLWLTFGSDRFGGEGSFDIYVVGRADVDAPWSDPVQVGSLSNFTAEASAALSDDLLEVVLTSPIGGGDELHRATRLAIGDDWGELAPITELNTLYRDSVPFLDVWGTRILFASDRPGTDGQMSIWTAVREPGAPFGEPEQVTDIDEVGLEDDPWWAPDGSVLYFSRTGPMGDLEIYAAAALAD